MKIIQANKFYFMRGGAERYVFDLSAWLRSQGHEIFPFAMRHPDNLETPYAEFFPSFIQTERVRVGMAGLKTFGRMFYSFEARRRMSLLIDAVRPDIAHIHSVYTQLSPSVLDVLHARRVSMVMTVHDHHLISSHYNVWAEGCLPVGRRGRIDHARAGIVRGTLSRFHKHSFAASFAQIAAFAFHYNRGSYRNRVNLFLTPSDYMRRKLVGAGFPEDRVRTVPYGMDPETSIARFDHDGYVLYYGRLSEEKGVETVIQVAKQLPDIPFKIVGTGPDEARLHALAHGTKNVEFVGFRSGELLQEVVRGALCVLVPSRVHENFPLVALESMGAGKPVVGSNVGGMPEVVEDRVTGLLVPPNDLHAWVEAVMRLAYDEDFRLGLARAARLSAETTFHIKRHHAAIMKAYADAIAMRG
ncbi:hypothetical protein A2348_00365 [Candidatus Uhrbacteria bacterium RIFOXYB12_FULL_58_10]|uniref:Glycosyltransferase subfamily 4-like N-terminal domain-containing protein n=1 Tax=Candidatus Uhrbacteria bacterium RIFOXYB2_FULL_57_15 TaxID=1802422 RepID=A0A1F7W6C2_9BACT|nr:MAG: hypothetical protein A2348_00365 [Candidatus Uhrbacteria bacterium RIFOXYB12_FULL_58_10]OGL98363.1 MAG: hypothetical protein A2304_01555 [Candidatus Uhrbacteria bacterium RIFOXYB2_FULL_57_15]